MAGAGELDKQSDETFDLLCTVCEHEGRNTEAVKYCTNCSDYFCLKCVKFHDKVPAFKGHKTVDMRQFQTGYNKPLPVVPTERCDRHGLKPVDTYCENHDDVGCSTCMTAEHRLCQDIFYIPDYIQIYAGASDPQGIQRELDSTEKTAAETLRRFEYRKQEAIKRKAESIKNITHFRKEIDKRLDELEQASIAEIEKKNNAVISKIEEEIQVIKDTSAEVTSAKDKLASAGNNLSQLFVTTKMAQTVAMDADKCLKERRPTSQEDISFIPDQQLSEMLNELKVLGHTEQQYSRKSEEKAIARQKVGLLQTKGMKQYPVKAIARQKVGLLQTKGMKQYPVKVQSDSKDCNIFSSCVLEDGTTILADNNNKNLKRLDRTTYCVRDYYNLPDRPWQVCATNIQEVAVSYQHKEIMFISLGNTMTKKCLTKTDFDCFGLAYTNDNLYITDRYTSVYVYTVSGSKLKQFRRDQSGQSLFSAYLGICSLAVCQEGLSMYVANGDNGLIVLDNNGQVIRKFNGPELNCAYDVHLTSSGTVLLCGHYSNNVLQFGPFGELMGEVLKPDRRGKGCKTVCCDKQMSKMIVGTKKNEIEVYDLV